VSDGGREHKPGAPAGRGAISVDKPGLVPRKTGLFGADRMDAANAERDEMARSLHHRLSIQRKAEGGSGAPAAIPEGGGQPLGADVRKRLEPKLGAGLGDVRVHTGGDSATAATQLGARAFTTGSDVHFGAGQFAPGTKEGDRLLAHELTHVVQGQRSGIQRKEAESHDAEQGQHDGAPAAAGGHEVSQPGEPAEKEADAVADKVTDELHDAGGNEKKSEKKDAQGRGAAHTPGGHGKDAGAQHSAGEAAPASSSHGGQDAAAGAPQQQAPAVAAKLSGESRKISRSPLPITAPQPSVGRKIFLAPAKSTPSTTATTTATGASSSAAATPPKPNLKTPQDVKKFCAPDPIAMQKLADVDGETNVDPSAGGSAKAKQEFYQHVMDYVNANPAVPANTIFNSCFDSAAKNWKFKGTKINPAAISRICSRTCSLSGWWWDVVKKGPFEAEARSVLGPTADKDSINALAQGMWKERVKDGANVMSSVDKSAAIKPKGQTWFTPDKIQLKSAGDVGFAELMRINALQPEWFPEGTVSFEIKPSAFHGDARKPTAYDGMQSALWVSRPDGDTYGVTGGSAKEFLAQNVQCSGITSARAIVPSTDLKGELQTAMKKAYDSALSMDPILKQAIDAEKDPTKKKALQGLVPNLTDQVIRGDLSFGSVPKAIREIIGDTAKTTALERKQPTKNKNPSGTGKRP